MKDRTPSLKTLLREIAPLLDLTEDQLYERQRELVRCNVLTERKGRGPGSGVPADYQTVSVLVASILAADALKDLKQLASNDEFPKLVQRVCDAIKLSSDISFARPNPSGMKATTTTLPSSLSGAIKNLLEEKAIKQTGRPRKFPRGRVCLSLRFTQKMHDLLVDRAEESGRSLSEELEMILEKAFFPMEDAVAERIREPNHAPKQERIHQA